MKVIIYNRPRTQVNYDCEDAKPYRNLRAVKWEWVPGDGAVRALEQTHVEVTGPPVKTLRDTPFHCWLCNGELKTQERIWTPLAGGR